MKTLRPHSVGLVFGIFLGAWHALWSLLVLAGFAQPVLDFVFRLHMITPPYQVGPFQAGTAIALVLVTAGLGFVIGWFMGLVWNRCVVREVR